MSSKDYVSGDGEGMGWRRWVRWWRCRGERVVALVEVVPVWRGWAIAALVEVEVVAMARGEDGGIG